MKQNDPRQPCLKLVGESARQFAERTGSFRIPIVSTIAAPIDGAEFGILSTFTIDGSRLSASQALSLAIWIAEETGGEVCKLLSDIQNNKCCLQKSDRFELEWIDPTASAWG